MSSSLYIFWFLLVSTSLLKKLSIGRVRRANANQSASGNSGHVTSSSQHGAARLLPVERVTDLDNDENGQRHRLRMRVVEDLTVETREHPRLGQTLHVMGLTDPRHYVTYCHQAHCLLISDKVGGYMRSNRFVCL